MEQSQNILQAINYSISGTGPQQKEGENYLNQFRDSNPNEYIKTLLEVLQTGNNGQKQFAVTQIRKLCSQFSLSSYPYIWEKLNNDNKKQLQQTLLVNCQKETNSTVRRMICECIGEIGSSLEEDYETALENNQQAVHEWPELLNNLWEFFKQDNNVSIQNGFIILDQLVQYTPEFFKGKHGDLQILFQNGIGNQDMDIQMAAIKCFSSFLIVQELKVVKEFDTLLVNVLEAIYNIIQKDSDKGEDAIQSIQSIAEYEPRYFKKQFSQFFSFVQKVFELKDIDQKVKQNCVQIVMDIISRQPNMISQNTQQVSSLCELIFYLMVDHDSEISEFWLKPPEGFNEDIDNEEDEDATRFGMFCIDQFINSLGKETTLKILGTTVENLLKHQNWRYQYSAIMALSQVGETTTIDEIDPIIKLVSNFFTHENPKIRYAVCHCIGQICDDMKPDFQNKYTDDLLPKLIHQCTDSVPRVSSHAYAAITNFVENMEADKAKNYLDQILQACIHAIQNGICIQKENSVTALAATADAAKQHFYPYLSKIMEILFQFYQAHPQEDYKQLRGQIIECISIISKTVEKQLYTPYLEQTVNLLLTLQESGLTDIDPQKLYIMSAWQRLCIQYHQELEPYLNKIIPSILQLINNIFSVDTTGDENEANTHEKEETEQAIGMLAVFIHQLKAKYLPYLESTVKLLVGLLPYSWSYKIRVSAAKCLSTLLPSLADNAEQQAKFCKYFIEQIYKAILQEVETDVISSQVTTIKELLEELKQPCYDQNELDQLAQNLFKILQDSDARNKISEQNQQDEDDEQDEEDQQQLSDDQSLEDTLHIAVGEVFGQLFRTHKQMTLQIANTIFTQILPNALLPQKRDRIHYFAIGIVADMVEFLEYDNLKDIWQHLLEALIKFSSDKDLQTRQAAIYGLGVFAKSTPYEVFQNYQQQVLEALKQGLDHTKENPEKYKQKFNLKCRDNCISSFGKIIKFQNQIGQFGELVQFWLGHLPLKNDKKEGLINHYLLCDIQTQTEIITGNPQNIIKAIDVYGQILGTTMCTHLLQEKITQCVKQLNDNVYVKENWNEIVKQVKEENLLKIRALLQ